MAKMNFGGVEENVLLREEFPVSKALETLKNETIAVIGYGVQGPAQSQNLRDELKERGLLMELSRSGSIILHREMVGETINEIL